MDKFPIKFNTSAMIEFPVSVLASMAFFSKRAFCLPTELIVNCCGMIMLDRGSHGHFIYVHSTRIQRRWGSNEGRKWGLSFRQFRLNCERCAVHRGNGPSLQASVTSQTLQSWCRIGHNRNEKKKLKPSNPQEDSACKTTSKLFIDSGQGLKDLSCCGYPSAFRLT